MYTHLFSELKVSGITLKKQIDDGTVVSRICRRRRYGERFITGSLPFDGQSGVAMIVVENATVDHPTGSGF